MMAQGVRDGLEGLYVPGEDLEEEIAALSWNTVGISALVILSVVIVAALTKNKIPKLKLPLFLIGSITMGLSFFILAGSTVYLNVNADSGGPVHWHADIEYWVCENEIELRDPTSALSNKIGTSTLHEHDDHRIHLEGVVVDDSRDATLGKFMYVVGGAITNDAMVIPVNDPDKNLFEDEEDGDGPAEVNPDQINDFIVSDDNGRYVKVVDGQTCGDQASEVQVFVYSINEDGKTYTQRKLDNPSDFVMAPESIVPDGDCVIFEFSPPKAATDKLCQQYGVKDVNRCASFGVEEDKRVVCEITEVNRPEEIQFNEPPVLEPGQLPDDGIGEETDAASGTSLAPDPVIAALCAPLYDNEGNLTASPANEVKIDKPDGTPLDYEADCVDYVNSLQLDTAPQAEQELPQ